MKKQIDRTIAATLVTLNKDICNLGCAVLVTYMPVTNCRPSRWKAEIGNTYGTGKKVTVFSPYCYSGGDSGKSQAAVKCLEKWGKTFNIPPAYISIHSRGFTGANGDLYFFTVKN